MNTLKLSLGWTFITPVSGQGGGSGCWTGAGAGGIVRIYNGAIELRPQRDWRLGIWDGLIMTRSSGRFGQ